MASSKNSSQTPPAPAKARTAANALGTAAALIGGILALNVVANRVFGRLDLTEDKLYKLSAASREAVAKLPDKMIVRAYISSNLQPQLGQIGRYVRDVLEEYSAASNGKLVWEAIDPLEGSVEEQNQKKEELKKYKIEPITLQSVSEAKLEISGDNYLGVAFVYGDKEIESLPRVFQTEGLEFNITSIIKKLTSQKKRKLAVASAEGELTTTQGMQIIGRVMRDYDINPATLDQPLADDIDVLIVAGPKKPFNDKAKYNIDQFLMKGKSVALFVDGMLVEAPQGMQFNLGGAEQPKMGRPNDTNLGDMLEKYGVKVRDDIIMDEQNAVGPVQIGQQMFLANHPVFVGVTEESGGFPGKWVVTENMKALILPFPSSVELVGDLKDKKVPGVTATPIAQSTGGGKSWRQTGFFLFNPQARPQKSAELGPFVFGYAIEGKLKSAFPGGPPGSDPNASTADSAKAIQEAPESTRLLVIGDSDMLNDQNLQVAQQVQIYQTNLFFFLNAVDWLAHDESLISLRIKGVSARPLTVTMDGATRTLIGFCVVGVPLLLVVFGVALWRVRTARRRSFRL
jgi:gliding-associated putative ABC transporter substrate-binding component GldG